MHWIMIGTALSQFGSRISTISNNSINPFDNQDEPEILNPETEFDIIEKPIGKSSFPN